MTADTALLVIDVQKAMFEADPPVLAGPALLPRLQGLIARARAAGVPVIYIQHCDPEGPLTPNTPSWEIHPAVAPLQSDGLVYKTHPDAFHDTELAGMLQSLGVRRLVICGMQTEYCIDSTTRRAFSLGYRVTLASDGHSTFDNDLLNAEDIIGHHNLTLDGWAAEVKPSDSIRFTGG